MSTYILSPDIKLCVSGDVDYSAHNDYRCISYRLTPEIYHILNFFRAANSLERAEFVLGHSVDLKSLVHIGLLVQYDTSHSRAGGFYDTLAREPSSSNLRFMNYGFSELESGTQILSLADPSPCIKLLLRLLNGVCIENMVVLDLACGRGGNCNYLADHLAPSRIVGVDYSPGNIMHSMLCNNSSLIEYLVADAHRLPFAVDCFDAVLCIEAAHLFAKLSTCFSEIYRVLKQPGHFFLADYVEIYEPTRLNWIDSVITDTGFKISSSDDISDNVAISISEYLASPPAKSLLARPAESQLGRLVYGMRSMHESLVTRNRINKLWSLAT